jgi:hypothetical protein
LDLRAFKTKSLSGPKEKKLHARAVKGAKIAHEKMTRHGV